MKPQLEEVLSHIEDVVLTQRYGDYVLDPQSLPRPDVYVGYTALFQEPYIDPDAFTQRSIPDFMVTALVRMFVSLTDYALMVRRVPHVAVNSYWVLGPQQAALQAAGYGVFLTPYEERFHSQLLCLRTAKGVFFAPVDILHDSMTRARLQQELSVVA